MLPAGGLKYAAQVSSVGGCVVFKNFETSVEKQQEQSQRARCDQFLNEGLLKEVLCKIETQRSTQKCSTNLQITCDYRPQRG